VTHQQFALQCRQPEQALLQPGKLRRAVSTGGEAGLDAHLPQIRRRDGRRSPPDLSCARGAWGWTVPLLPVGACREQPLDPASCRRLFRPRIFEAGGIRQLVQQGSCRGLLAIPGPGRIQASHLHHRADLQCFHHLADGAGQSRGQLGGVELRLAQSAAPVLQNGGPTSQLPQRPGNAHQAGAITQFVLDRATDIGNGEAAQSAALRGLISIDGPQKSKGTDLTQIVLRQRLCATQTSDDGVDQRQIPADQLTAEGLSLRWVLGAFQRCKSVLIAERRPPCFPAPGGCRLCPQSLSAT